MHQPGQVQAGAGAGAAKHVLRPSVVWAQPSPERKGPELQASDAEGVRSGSGSGSNVPGGDIKAWHLVYTTNFSVLPVAL